MRSCSSSLSRRTRRRPSVKDREIKKARGIKHKSKEFAVQIKKSAIISVKILCKNARDHPFFTVIVLNMFLLYVFLPSFFWFLVSCSPVIICTALLLGTLLSFGKPHIPEVEEVETKTVPEASSLQVSSAEGNLAIKKEDDYLVESSSTSDSEDEDSVPASTLEVGESSQKVDCKDNAVSFWNFLGFTRQVKSRDREFEEARNIVAEIMARRQLPEAGNQSEPVQDMATTKLSSVDVLEVGIQHCNRDYSFVHNQMVSGDALEVSEHDVSGHQEEGAVPVENEELGKFKPESGTCYYTLLKPSDENDDHSDFGSDRSESYSPDASMTDIGPMLDELCPFIPSDRADDPTLGPFAPIHADDDHSDSESELSTQPHGSDYASDELEENMEDEQENKHGDGVAWTSDDEKNVMVLGSSEIERNRRLEHLITKRRERRNLNPQSGSFLELVNEDASQVTERLPQLRVQVSSMPMNKKNPFDDYSEDIGNLPPIPGSAPSILSGKLNPFDFPDRHLSESGSDIAIDQRELFMQGFSQGAPGVDGEEKENVNLIPYFVPEEKSYGKYQRQLSEISYPRMRSTFQPEPLYPLPDQEYHRAVLDQDLHEENDFISFTKCDGILKDDDLAAPSSTSLAMDMRAWTGPVGDVGTHVHSHALDTLEAHSTLHAQPTIGAVPTDATQYQNLATLEGNAADMAFGFGSHDKLDSPRLQSYETLESDSSTESRRSVPEHAGADDMIRPSHPSTDEPVVLPSEFSISPVPFQVEEKPRDIVMDYMEEVDEHILSELDAVGDFSIVNFPQDHEQVGKQLDDNPESQDCENINLTEPNALNSGSEAKIESTKSSLKEDEEIKFQSSKQAEEQGCCEVETHFDPKAVDFNLHEIDARCLDDIDLALMHAEGSLHHNIVEVEAHSGPEAADSDMHEIKARSLDDIDLALMHAEGSLCSFKEGETQSTPKAFDSGLHEIDARCLDDIDLALMDADGSLFDDSMKEEQSEQVNSQFDLHELKVRSLDELDEALLKLGTPRAPTLISSEFHNIESLDLHEIEARSLDGLHETLGKQAMSLDMVVTPLEQHKIQERHVQDMEVESRQYKEHEAISDPDTLGPSNILGDLNETGDKILESEHQNIHLVHKIVPSCLLEDGVQDTRELGQNLGREGPHSEMKVLGLHEIKAESLEENPESMSWNTTNTVVSEMHEVKAESIEELRQVLKTAEETPEPMSSHASTVVSEVHEIEAQSLEHLVLKKQDANSEMVEADATQNFTSEQQTVMIETKKDLSESPRVEVQTSKDFHSAIVFSDLSEISDLHIVKAKSLQVLDEAIGKLHESQTVIIQSKNESPSIDEINSALALVPGDPNSTQANNVETNIVLGDAETKGS